MASSNRLSYPSRLFVWLLGYSLLLAGCFILFQYHREKEFKAEALNTRLQGVNHLLLAELARGIAPDSITPADINAPEGLRISIIGRDGHVLYDNSLDTLPDSNHLDRREIVSARTKGEGYSVRRHSSTTGHTYFYSATAAADGLVVRSAVPYTLNLAGVLHADMGFLWSMGIVTLAMCIIGYFATRRIGQHLLRLNRFAARAERGERIYDTSPFPPDEFGSISNHIVRLYANLQQAIADRDREHARALYQQREKERIKRQLTNNINHELKTPVASIRLCLETLIEHPGISEEKRLDFLRRSLHDTDRLQRLLADVATITRMEEAPASITKSPLDLTEVVADVVADAHPLAEAAGMRIEDDIDFPISITANRQLLESAFRNLLDNAIAYSGASRITITAQIADDRRAVRISVADDGAGVDPRHLPHLFERFYRVDKGRSRATGGTGLGLAIVKNAIVLHGGRIEAELPAAGGLRFIITLPLG